ncbi:hypothetical protein CB0940_04947 [Cercospora beticola]|nr:hypothetical protein CB0940_04947 [Cercospora beticola]PIA93343.1 hypothetical protein CB0940_04947 [Cercospora beticola]
MAATGILSITLYGILVTEESFLKGFRTYSKTQHERKLVTLVAGEKVPPELLELMHEAVQEQARAIINKKWDACNSNDERLSKFSYDDLKNEQGAVRVHIGERAVDATVVAAKAPQNLATPNDVHDGITRYVHLSIPGQAIQPVNFPEQTLVPHTRYPTASGSIWEVGPEACVATSRASTTSGPQLHTDFFFRLLESEEEEEEEICVSRLLRLKNVKAAIKNWDARLIKKLVEALDLEVVPFDADEPFEPELLQYQCLATCWR